MNSVREDIRKESFRQAYLFYGEQAYLKQKYRDELLTALGAEEGSMNFTRFEGKDVSVKELIDLCETLPFFADRRIVLLEDTGFFKNKAEELADYMKTLPEYLVLVFAEEQADKRSRMYKAVKETGRIVECATPAPDKLKTWAAVWLKKNGRAVRERDVDLLLSRIGTDMGSLCTEMEKLTAYTEGKTEVTAEDIEAICSVRTENRVFEMVRAVTERNQKKALQLYRDLLNLKEPPMRILYLLARQYRQLYLIRQLDQKGVSRRELGSRLSLSDYVVKNLISCARAYSAEDLAGAVRDFTEAEEAVKTGKLMDVLSVELMIVKYSRKR